MIFDQHDVTDVEIFVDTTGSAEISLRQNKSNRNESWFAFTKWQLTCERPTFVKLEQEKRTETKNLKISSNFEIVSLLTRAVVYPSYGWKRPCMQTTWTPLRLPKIKLLRCPTTSIEKNDSNLFEHCIETKLKGTCWLWEMRNITVRNNDFVMNQFTETAESRTTNDRHFWFFRNLRLDERYDLLCEFIRVKSVGNEENCRLKNNRSISVERKKTRNYRFVTAFGCSPDDECAECWESEDIIQSESKDEIETEKMFFFAE